MPWGVLEGEKYFDNFPKYREQKLAITRRTSTMGAVTGGQGRQGDKRSHNATNHKATTTRGLPMAKNQLPRFTDKEALAFWIKGVLSGSCDGDILNITLGDGICRSCHNEQIGVAQDATHDVCKVCGQRQVVAIDALLSYRGDDIDPNDRRNFWVP